MWYNRLWQNTVDFFRSLDIPVRTLECCSGDLADLKVKSLRRGGMVAPPAEVLRGGLLLQPRRRAGAPARASASRARNGKKYLAHTLNNTVVAPPRMLIAFLENNLQADGTIRIPEPLRPYMGGKEVLSPNC